MKTNYVHESFEIDQVTLAELMHQYSQIEIPSYQREYDWREKEWAELWTDLIGSAREREKYFIGPINAERLSNGQGILIADGQQRLTTLSILLNAINGYLNEEDKVEILNILFSNAHNKDPLALKPRLIDQTSTGQAKLLRALRATEFIPIDIAISHQETAYNYFFSMLSKLQPNEILSLKDFILNRIVFARVVAQEAGTGIKMFERSNTRGRPLTFTDKLKSLLIGSADRLEAAEIINNWSTTVTNLRTVRKYDDRRFIDWLMTDFGDADKPLRASSALDVAREVVAAGPLDCSRKLLEYSHAVRNIWERKTPKGGNDCGSLWNILNFSRFSQLVRVLPAARDLPEDSFVKLAASIENTVCVIAIARAFPPDIEKLMPGLLKTTRDVRDGDTPLQTLLKELESIRNQYSQKFGDRLVNGTSVDFKRPYLLTLWGLMEQYCANTNTPKPSKKERKKVDLSEISIEHILAKSSNARPAAREYGVHHAPKDRERFANLTPLEKSLNVGTAPYSVKARSFVNSNFFLTSTMSHKYNNSGLKTFLKLRSQYLPAYRTWNRNQLENRAQRLYRLACESLELEPQKIAITTPEEPTLETAQYFPRVSSVIQLATSLKQFADNGKPTVKHLSTLRFIGLVDEEDEDDRITELGQSILELPPREQHEKIAEVISEHSYLSMWAELSDVTKKQLLNEDVRRITGAIKPIIIREISTCLDVWSKNYLTHQ
jgi:hypothetical protein